MIYLGDYPTNHTAVVIPFASFAAATGASSATSNFASSDILIYKNGGTTQRTSASGITVTTSFDSQTGLNLIVIDLSDNTDVGFYAAGAEYTVGVADITVDSQTVRFWAGSFSIERAGGALAILKAALSGSNFKADVVAISGDTTAADNLEAAADGAGYNLGGGSIVVASVTGAVGSVTGNVGGNVTGSVGSIATGGIAAASFAAGAVDAAALAADAGTEIATAVWASGTRVLTANTNLNDPTAAAIADAVWDEAQADHVAAGSFGVTASEIADILVDTAEIGAAGAGLTNINLPDQTMNITGNITGNLSGSVGSVTGAVGSVTGAVGSVTGNVGGNVSGSVGSIATGGIAAASFAAGAIDAAAIAADAIGASELAADAAVEIAAAVWDRVLTGATHNIANSAGRRLRIVDAAFEVHSGTAQAGSTATTFVMDTGASTTNDIYNGDRIIVTAGTGAEEHGIIIDYDGATRTATMSRAWVVTPDATSEFSVVPADTDVEAWNHGAVTGDGDWAELQTDVDAILVDTAEIGAAGAGLTALATQASVNTIDDFLDTEVAAIKAKTDSLTFTVAGQVDANIQSVNDVTVTGDGQPGTEWGP